MENRNVPYSVDELVDMARAFSEGEFDKQFGEHFLGELGRLGSYLEAISQTLFSISSSASQSNELLPKAASRVADNSAWEAVEGMQASQEPARRLLSGAADLKAEDIGKLKVIAEKNRQSLINLMGDLSFHDVLRQRVEKVATPDRAIVGKILGIDDQVQYQNERAKHSRRARQASVAGRGSRSKLGGSIARASGIALPLVGA